MADPVTVACPAGEWTKVATDQTTGVIHILSTAPDNYSQTYRDTGEDAPTLISEGVPFNPSLQISAAAGIDVYVWPQSKEAKAGSVRVDL